mgnify:CR=1 FL=1
MQCAAGLLGHQRDSRLIQCNAECGLSRGWVADQPGRGVVEDDAALTPGLPGFRLPRLFPPICVVATFSPLSSAI